jgi:hypothetical protein
VDREASFSVFKEAGIGIEGSFFLFEFESFSGVFDDVFFGGGGCDFFGAVAAEEEVVYYGGAVATFEVAREASFSVSKEAGIGIEGSFYSFEFESYSGVFDDVGFGDAEGVGLGAFVFGCDFFAVVAGFGFFWR